MQLAPPGGGRSHTHTRISQEIAFSLRIREFAISACVPEGFHPLVSYPSWWIKEGWEKGVVAKQEGEEARLSPLLKEKVTS